VKYVSVSQIIKAATDLNTPASDYFNNFLPAYKAYHQRQNVRRTVQKVISLVLIFVVACFIYVSINNNDELDILTASGTEMTLNDLKVIVHEGTVTDVTRFIKDHVKEPTKTLNLRDYFQGDDVWGVYVEGEDKFRYYYQCLGKGQYTIFIMKE
jgi:hypothetical protein